MPPQPLRLRFASLDSLLAQGGAEEKALDPAQFPPASAPSGPPPNARSAGRRPPLDNSAHKEWGLNRCTFTPSKESFTQPRPLHGFAFNLTITHLDSTLPWHANE